MKTQIRLLLSEQSDLDPHCLPLQLYLPINRHFSDAVILLAFQRFNDMVCVFTEVLWRKTIQLLSN